MKRDFLKGLGIEDSSIIDKILDENGADLSRERVAEDVIDGNQT